MAYEEIGYWEEENWNRFFSKVWEISSEVNPAIIIKEELEKEWNRKPISDIFNDYREFFLPEIIETEEGKRRVEPWFLRFFGVNFTEMDYDGFLYRVEHKKDFGDLKVEIKYRGEGFDFFAHTAGTAKEIGSIAGEKGFNVTKKDLSKIELKDSEEIRKTIIETFDKTINLGLPYEPTMFFVWSLSHGVMDDYAKEAYKHFDEGLIFERLRFKRERNYDLIVKGDYSSLSAKINELNRYILEISGYEGDTLLKVLGFENKPQIMDLYFDRAFDSLKGIDLSLSKEVVDKIIGDIQGYSGGWGYFKGRDYHSMQHLAEIARISPMELLEALNPFLFLGILRYENHKIDGWRELMERWSKI